MAFMSSNIRQKRTVVKAGREKPERPAEGGKPSTD
jgi:hypothetical protein